MTHVVSPPPEHHADPSLKTYVFRVGPFSVSGYQTFRHNDIVEPPPVAGSVVGMDVRVVDGSGDEIPQSQVMLHHNVFTNGGPDGTRRDGACPLNSVNERFYGTSEELRPLTLPRGYGYPTDPQDRWKMILDGHEPPPPAPRGLRGVPGDSGPGQAHAGHAVLAERRAVRIRSAVISRGATGRPP